jgi:hypothetical protein
MGSVRPGSVEEVVCLTSDSCASSGSIDVMPFDDSYELFSLPIFHDSNVTRFTVRDVRERDLLSADDDFLPASSWESFKLMEVSSSPSITLYPRLILYKFEMYLSLVEVESVLLHVSVQDSAPIS